jgi:hypothetical protein
MRPKQIRILPTAASPFAASGTNIVLPQPTVSAVLPSTWPAAPRKFDEGFAVLLQTLFEDAVLTEIRNVIEDSLARNNSLERRGHVIGVAMMCALDSLSCFASMEPKQGDRIRHFIRKFFGPEFHPFADIVYRGYRNGLVHEWFLTTVAFTPDDEPVIVEASGNISMGLLTFHKGLENSVSTFLKTLRADTATQRQALRRYRKLQQEAVP